MLGLGAAYEGLTTGRPSTPPISKNVGWLVVWPFCGVPSMAAVGWRAKPEDVPSPPTTGTINVLPRAAPMVSGPRMVGRPLASTPSAMGLPPDMPCATTEGLGSVAFVYRLACNCASPDVNTVTRTLKYAKPESMKSHARLSALIAGLLSSWPLVVLQPATVTHGPSTGSATVASKMTVRLYVPETWSVRPLAPARGIGPQIAPLAPSAPPRSGRLAEAIGTGSGSLANTTGTQLPDWERPW